jgi:hypothetical protein
LRKGGEAAGQSIEIGAGFVVTSGCADHSGAGFMERDLRRRHIEKGEPAAIVTCTDFGERPLGTGHYLIPDRFYLVAGLLELFGRERDGLGPLEPLHGKLGLDFPRFRFRPRDVGAVEATVGER